MKILMRDTQSQKWELVDSNAYGVESELQKLLANSPEIINMEEIRPGAGPLVASVAEFPLPVGYVDILGFTARGDIAIIECKLARNTQTKREVIGQILDYAAHLWGLSYADLDQQVQSKTNLSLADLVRQYTAAPDWDEEVFRSNVSLALEQGSFILTVAVNEINEELHRIVRFVNSAGTSAFSLTALEMRRFSKANIEMLVPHFFGALTAPVSAKSTRRKWDRTTFFAALQQEKPAVVPVAQQILAWCEAHSTRIWWGEGARSGSFVPVYRCQNQDHQLFAVWTTGYIEIYFYWYAYKAPFNDENKLLEIWKRLNAIPGVKLERDAISRRPSITLDVFQKPATLQQLLQMYEWFLDEIQQSGTV